MNSKLINILLVLIALFVGAIGAIGIKNFTTPIAPAQSCANSPVLGSAISAPLYWTVTNSSVACSAATSTLIIGSETSRNYFAATNNDSANQIYICKGASCSASTGVRLNAPGGSYEQTIANDGYVGPYSCIASTATSTLTIQHSNQVPQ